MSFRTDITTENWLSGESPLFRLEFYKPTYHHRSTTQSFNLSEIEPENSHERRRLDEMVFKGNLREKKDGKYWVIEGSLGQVAVELGLRPTVEKSEINKKGRLK